MDLVVQKYGGSSLRSPSHILTAARRIADSKKRGGQVVVVVSAMGRATDFLIRLANRTVARPPQREMDMLLTAGERVSMALMAMALEEIGVPAISFTGSQSGILTTEHHANARIVDIRPIRIREALDRGQVPIVAGFQGVSARKDVTTLGRGGSDTTAVALAARLGARQCEVFTDVDGLFTADPRVVPNARLLQSLGFPIAIEMAERGAKMHPRSLQLAERFGVRIRIASNRANEGEGTMVEEQGMESAQFQAVATKQGFDWFGIEGEATRWLPTLSGFPTAAFNIREGGVNLLVESSQADALDQSLTQTGLVFERRSGMCSVSLVGSLCRDALHRVLSCVHSLGHVPLLVEASAHGIAMVFPQALKAPVAQHLHQEFLEKQP